MTRFTVYSVAPAELCDDAPALECWLQMLKNRVPEQVTALGHNVTSEVSLNGPSFRVTYWDLNGEYREGPVETRHPSPYLYPCPRCRVPFGACVFRLPFRLRIRRRRYHAERYPSVTAGYFASAETDHVE